MITDPNIDLELHLARDPAPGELAGMKVVLINGPPYSGKDTAGKHLESVIPGVRRMKFAEHLKRSVLQDFGLPQDMDLDAWDPIKDQPLDVFCGLSFRQALIKKAEQQVKPFFGNDFYGRMFLRSLRKAKVDGVICAAVTDSGFAEEAIPVMEAVGQENVLLLRTHRTEHTFAGDSRNYLELPVRTCDLYNNGSLGRVGVDAEYLVGAWLDVGLSIAGSPRLRL